MIFFVSYLWVRPRPQRQGLESVGETEVNVVDFRLEVTISVIPVEKAPVIADVDLEELEEGDVDAESELYIEALQTIVKVSGIASGNSQNASGTISIS